MDKRLRFGKGDILAVAVVMLLAMGVFLFFLPPKEEPVIAEVYQDGALAQILSLSEDQTTTVEGRYRNCVTVRDGKVAITETNCPGEDCAHSGWIGSTGRSIVCLPNGVEVRVVGLPGDVDFVVG